MRGKSIRPPRLPAPEPSATEAYWRSDEATPLLGAGELTTNLSWYRTVSLLGLVAAIAQVALGGVVRVTGSGDACPDWPLCHGQIIPPLDLNIWLEFSHRLSASVLGVLVLVAWVLACKTRQSEKIAWLATSAALALVIAAAVLGGLTVLSELAWWIRLIHLALAELVVACITVAWLAGSPTRPDLGVRRHSNSARRQNRVAALITLGALLGVILYGSYMVGFNYGASCTSWPMCQGLRIPDGLAFVVNMGHRVTTAGAALLVFWLSLRAWRFDGGIAQIRWFALAAVATMMLAVLFGALMVWLNFSILMRSLHLVIATLVWTSAVGLFAVMADPTRLRVRSIYMHRTSGQ